MRLRRNGYSVLAAELGIGQRRWPEKLMTPQTGHAVLILTAGFAGLLAGASADRYLVQVPGWRHLDVMTWAEHSRHADLGNGRFWYPLLAFAATGFSIATAIAVRQHVLVASGLEFPAYLAALFELLGLSITVLAAPNLIRLRRPQDLATTERSFRLFHRWGLLRAAFQIMAFPISLWAVWVLVRAR